MGTIVNELPDQAKTAMTARRSFLRALATQPKELKHVRLHGKIVGLLDLSLKGVKVVVRYLNALDILARGAHQVVMMVVRMEQFVPLHPIQNIYLREDLIIRKEIELSVDRGFVDRGVFVGHLLKKLGGGDRLARRDKRLNHRLTDLGDAKALRS